MFTQKEQHEWQLATFEQFKLFKSCNNLDDLIPLGQLFIRSFLPLKEELKVLKSMGLSTDVWNNDTQLLKIKNLFPKADIPEQIYYLNEWNHRDSWVKKKKIVGVFGCSCTFGVGVDKNFCNYLEEDLGDDYAVWNFGTQAYNIIHMAKKYIGISNLIDFDTIIMMFPSLRLLTLRDGLFKELGLKSKLEPFSPEYSLMLEFLDTKYYDSLFQDIHQGKEPEVGAVLAKFADYIVDTAQKKKTKVIISGWDTAMWFTMKNTYPELTLDRWEWEDRSGFDAMHPGPKSHRWITDAILAQMYKYK